MAKKKTQKVQVANESDLKPTTESELTPRQERFVREYVNCGIGGLAARRAGYSPNGADQQAAFLLRNIKISESIAAKKAEREKKFNFTVERWVNENMKAAFSDLGDVLEWDNGVVIKKKEDMDEDARQCIEGITETVTEHGGTISVKMRDKNKALEMLGKHFGLLDGNGSKRNTEDVKAKLLAALEKFTGGGSKGSNEGSV